MTWWNLNSFRNITRQAGISIIIITKLLCDEDKPSIAKELDVPYSSIQNKEKYFFDSLELEAEEFYNEFSIIKFSQESILKNKQPLEYKLGTRINDPEQENWRNIQNKLSEKEFNIENIEEKLEEFFSLSTVGNSRTLSSLFNKIKFSLEDFGVEMLVVYNNLIPLNL